VLFGAPFIVPLLFGVRASWRAAPPWVRCAAVCGVVYLLVEFKSNRFSGGAPFWSYRYPLEGLTLLAPPLLLAWREHVTESARRRAISSALVIFAVALQAVGAICFRSDSGSGAVAWLFIDLDDAIRVRPVTSLTILVIGYVSAAVAYRKLAVPKGDPLPTRPSAWMRSARREWQQPSDRRSLPKDEEGSRSVSARYAPRGIGRQRSHQWVSAQRQHTVNFGPLQPDLGTG
jgi:hypothetical protein